MSESTIDRRVTDWLEDGPPAASDRVLAAVLDHVRRHPRRPGRRGRLAETLRAVIAQRRVVVVYRPAVIIAAIFLAAALTGIYLGARVGLPGPAPSSTPSPRQGISFACPAGSKPDQPGPMDQLRPPLDEGLERPLVADARSGRLVMLVGQDSTKKPWPSGQWQGTTVWVFDACTNTWRAGAAAVTDGALAYDAATDRVYIFGADAVTAYDADTDTSVELGQVPLPSAGGFDALRSWEAAANPSSGLIVVRHKASNRLWTYDPARDAWAEIAQRGDLPAPYAGTQLLAFDASVGRVILYTRGPERAATHEFDPATGTWTSGPTVTPTLNFPFGDLGTQGIAYDERNERTVVFSDGWMIAYDAAAHAWETIFKSGVGSGTGTGNRMRFAMTYDPVNARLVVAGGSRREDPAWVDTDEVLAFDLISRSWQTLLAASGS